MKTPADLLGYRIVERLNVASVAGLIVASAAFFWANRLIPDGLADRAALEIRVVMTVWALCVVHALMRRHAAHAWREQLGAGAALGLALPLVNAWTGGAGLPTSVAEGRWDVAGVDLTAVAAALLLAWTAWRVARRGAG